MRSAHSYLGFLGGVWTQGGVGLAASTALQLYVGKKKVHTQHEGTDLGDTKENMPDGIESLHRVPRSKVRGHGLLTTVWYMEAMAVPLVLSCREFR